MPASCTDRQILLTCDGRGVQAKSGALDRVIAQAVQEALQAHSAAEPPQDTAEASPASWRPVSCPSCGHSARIKADRILWAEEIGTRGPGGEDEYWKSRVDAMLASSAVPNPIAAAFVLGREYDRQEEMVDAEAIRRQLQRLEAEFLPS